MHDPGPPSGPRQTDPAGRSDITVTLRCNNACRFCPRPTLRHIHVDGGEALEQRLAALRERSTQVTLSGGEVTELPDLVELVGRCAERGFAQIGIITNARRLADADLARRLVQAGLTEACVTVYDLRPAVHDGLTSTPGSLAETLAGLDNLLALARELSRLLVRVNTLLCVSNVDGLVDLLRDLAQRGVRRFLVGDMLLSERYPRALAHDRVVALARTVESDPLLRRVAVELRGFPPCVLRDVAGIQVAPHEVDTALLEEADRDAYFAEFQQAFTHVEACQGCALGRRCPGVQRRYLEQLDASHIASLAAPPATSPAPTGEAAKRPATEPGPRWEVSSQELEEAREELARFPPWTPSGRLEVHTTTACPFRCTYCGVALGERHAPPEVLDRAVDLLLTSSRDRLELQFFGGEPLLRWAEVARTLQRGTARARALGKALRFVITTSGLLLKPQVLDRLRDFDVEVLYSLDGGADVMRRQRPLARSGADVTAILDENLRRLLGSGLDCFVNMVVTPEEAADLPRRLEHVLGLGARRVQICYALAPGWTESAREAFCESLAVCAERMASGAPGLRLQNLGSAAEPTILSHDLIVDVDGTLYHDAALFGERVLPGLRDACRVGSIFELARFDGLRRSREENLVRFRRAFPDPGSPQRRLLEEQLDFGWQIHQVQASLAARFPSERAPSAQIRRDSVPPSARAPTRARAPRVLDRNPLQQKVLRRSLAHQARFMQSRPELLALPLLMLENPCEHDCLFCMAKPLTPTPLAGIRQWLAQNRSAGLGLTRLGIAGNEPLLHPDVDDILAAAREAGFESFEVLTSGAPLADPERARTLFEAGAQAYALPLHAADPSLHDRITQAPGSHAATVRAIGNLRELGATIYVHANLLQTNLDDLARLQALVRDDWGLPLSVLPVRAKAANRPYAELVPTYAEVVRRARVQCLVAFPLCVADQVQQPALPPGDLLSDVLKVYVLDQPFIKPPRCATCGWRGRCAGTFQAYLDLYGDAELKPS